MDAPHLLYHGYDLQQHFPDDTVLVERYRPERVYAVCYFDREQNYYYLKRFPIESSDKTQFFLDEEGTGRFRLPHGTCRSAAGSDLCRSTGIAACGAHRKSTVSSVSRATVPRASG